MTRRRIYAVAAGIGLVAGLRSLIAPTLVSNCARSGELRLHDTPFAFLGSEAMATTSAVLAGGELIADKLPFIPARTDPAPLMIRALVGGMCGAAVSSSTDEPVLPGALIGAAAALCGSFAGYHLRRRAVKQDGIPDLAFALSEDCLAVFGGMIALSFCRNELPEVNL